MHFVRASPQNTNIKILTMASLATTRTLVKNSKILVVDDSVTSRFMLSGFFRSSGFTKIEEAKDGREALDKIISWQPDIVLMDVNMPVMSGLDACRKLRDIPNCNPIIIIQTASESREFIVEAFGCGVSDFIHKPIQFEELIARSTYHLERRIFSNKIEAEYSRIRAELKEAAMLQSLILPKDTELEEIGRSTSLDIAQYYQPSSELGGDYLAVKKISDNNVALITADVCGHGITSALYAFTIHNMLQDIRIQGLEPGQALELINSELCGLMVGGKFVTMSICSIDTQSSTIKYAAAGSTEPLLISNGKAEYLDSRGYPLGIKNNASYETFSRTYNKGDLIFLYSDALIETADADGDFLSESELAEIIVGQNQVNSSALLRNIVSAFFSRYSKNLSDDFSLLVCKF